MGAGAATGVAAAARTANETDLKAALGGLSSDDRKKLLGSLASLEGGDEKKPKVVFILGGPGAGKGTQCDKIKSAYGFQHLSAGDLLREERQKPGSELGELIESCIKEGKLVPADITVKLLRKAMEAGGWAGGKYLIDGFPRSQDNLDSWNSVMEVAVNVKMALFLDCTEEVMEARLLERGKTSGRADDNPETIKKRFKTFSEESVPVANKLETLGMLRRVDGKQKIDDVWASVEKIFKAELAKT